jgi:GNAT superfamily N-acetyltransferase
VLWEYFGELVRRYQGRPAADDEIDQALIDAPSHDLVGSTGVFLLAFRDSTAVGCIGLRYRDPVGEVTRMFVVADERRRGVGLALLSEIEDIARRRGMRRLELDTRDDLVEARRLYAKFGFDEVAAFNAGPFAEHWFAKTLT